MMLVPVVTSNNAEISLATLVCGISQWRSPGYTALMLSDLQTHELHTKHSVEAMKAEKWQFEYNNLHDKYEALLKEKEVSW